jgi:HSP20 family protein
VAHIYRERSDADPERRRRGDDPQLRQLVDDEDAVAAGECSPPMDVLETAEAVEVLVDLPGVPRGNLRILFSQGTLIIVGRKLPSACAHREAAFHLAERSFGRFARAVRLNGAFDAGQASATILDGELRIVLPRIEERRGRDIHIPITQPG